MNQSENEKRRIADRNGIVGDIGEHLVCFELSRLELRAVRTKAGAKGVDIIAYDPNTYRTATVQVKAMVSHYPWADFSHPRDKNVEGGAEQDKKFCNSPIPDFVVLVRLDGYSSYKVEDVYVWHRCEKHLLRACRTGKKPIWRLDGSNAKIKGGKSQEDGKIYPPLYREEPREVLGKIKKHLE